MWLSWNVHSLLSNAQSRAESKDVKPQIVIFYADANGLKDHDLLPEQLGYIFSPNPPLIDDSSERQFFIELKEWYDNKK